MLLRNVFEQHEALKRDLIGKSPEEAKKLIEETKKRISLAIEQSTNVPVRKDVPDSGRT